MVSGKKISIPQTILNVAANAASDKEGYTVSREEVAKKWLPQAANGVHECLALKPEEGLSGL